MLNYKNLRLQFPHCHSTPTRENEKQKKPEVTHSLLSL